MLKAFQLAPDKLWQAINPLTFFQQGAQFGFINLNLGTRNIRTSSRPFSIRLVVTGGNSAASVTHLKL